MIDEAAFESRNTVTGVGIREYPSWVKSTGAETISLATAQALLQLCVCNAVESDS